MTYYFSKTISTTFENALQMVAQELEKEGFGIITEINVTETFKKKLNVSFRPYQIIGACNPNLAYQALSFEDNMGVMLPCNIVVQEKEEKKIHISVINPIMSLQGIDNKNLDAFAVEVSQALLRVLNNIEA